MDSISSSASSSHTAGIGTRSYMRFVTFMRLCSLTFAVVQNNAMGVCIMRKPIFIGRFLTTNMQANRFNSLGIILYELFSKFGTHSERARKLQDLKQGIVDQTLWVQYPNVVCRAYYLSIPLFGAMKWPIIATVH